MRTQIVALLFVMIVTCYAAVLSAMAAENSAIGTFTVANAAPTVTDVVLYSGDESDT